MRKFDVSFIVPAFNEESEIATTINSIFASMQGLEAETIVVDNLSTDRTKEICEELGVVTITSSSKTIAGVRNEGAKVANGEFLVFVDADVSLDKNWGENFKKIINTTTYPSGFIFGSRCKTPFLDYVSRGWFSKLDDKRSNYINSGHLIVPKSLFLKIGGFTSHLTTAEDVDICQKAIFENIAIIHTPELKAFHRGFPRNLRDFTRREIWHGHQDFSTLPDFLSSKTALFSLIVILIFIGALGASILFMNPVIAIYAIAFFVLSSYIFYCHKTQFSNDSLIFWPIASCYIVGRALSLTKNISSKPNNSPRSINRNSTN
jgi:glycosyltransferase involved in cell wall biosynthesis